VPRRRVGPAIYRIECGCGFAVEGDEDEVVDAARRHADTAHGIDLADGIVRALARPIEEPRSAARVGQPDPRSGRHE
jgi:hypothetical protein